ncbi:hypothetical protein GCM10010503_36740 [Streptomyces lucensis JCM 4490]|uniref:Secreted protein n=1 Tax=Streptomyces lucensis JCM 4490 TaxID=1306176 RepID=A0A918J7P1_9ACTN|nr:hypothetical protein [Streptomyces lucensis]GGW56265.1 hypothetical protein GCM10010503_36740 [Streptomyces lucensis JCM 4490]
MNILSKILRGAAPLVVAAAAITPLGGSAQAASGGGCLTYVSPPESNSTVKVRPCISSPGRGVARPDAYITSVFGYFDGLKNCRIGVSVLQAGQGGRKISSKVFPCPSHDVQGLHLVGTDVHANSGSYATYVTLMATNDAPAHWPGTPRSPFLKLP